MAYKSADQMVARMAASLAACWVVQKDIETAAERVVWSAELMACPLDRLMAETMAAKMAGRLVGWLADRKVDTKELRWVDY
jgi:F0F1-type ATP synthase assembly protein I